MRRSPAEAPDPQRKGGDGMKAAMRPGGRGGKPARPGDPQKAAKGDGVKAAMSDRGKKGSKLSPMNAAKQNVR